MWILSSAALTFQKEKEKKQGGRSSTKSSHLSSLPSSIALCSLPGISSLCVALHFQTHSYEDAAHRPFWAPVLSLISNIPFFPRWSDPVFSILHKSNLFCPAARTLDRKNVPPPHTHTIVPYNVPNLGQNPDPMVVRLFVLPQLQPTPSFFKTGIFP